MSPGLWDRFDRIIQEIEENGPHSASRIKQIAIERVLEEEESVRRMVLAYYAIAVDPIRSQEGQDIGNYQLGRLIGEGAMGAVYLGKERTRPYRNVAVKLIHPRYSNRFLRELFLNQIDRYRHLNHHPQIVPLFSADIFLDPNTKAEIPYYVMPYIQGNMNLRSFITQNGPGEVERLRLFKRICSGVRHLHHNGIIHGDLKFSNILVDQEGHPYIIDFGLDVDLLSDRSKAKGFKAAFRAADARTDIRSLGGVLGGLFGKGSDERPTSPSFLKRFLNLTQRQPDAPEHPINDSKPYRCKGLQAIMRKAGRSMLTDSSDQGYRAVDELIADVDRLVNKYEVSDKLFNASYKKWFLFLGIGIATELVGHLTGSLYAQTGRWMLIHMAVALFVIGLFLCLTIQYLRHLAPVFNQTLKVAYGTGLVSSLIGALIYAFGPPAHAEIHALLDPVWHIKFIRFMATGMVLPVFYAIFLALGSAKRIDPHFRVAEWRVVSWLLLWFTIGVLIFTSIHLIEHPILSLFFGNRMQGDVRCEIFILVAYLCTVSLIWFENWQALSNQTNSSQKRLSPPEFLARLSAALIYVSISGMGLAATFWGQGLTPDHLDGTFALLTIGLILLWSLVSCALFTGNHAFARWFDKYLSPYFRPLYS
jgi:hypothetical protein